MAVFREGTRQRHVWIGQAGDSHSHRGEGNALLLLDFLKVAVKILEKEKIKDKKDVERITREIKILKKVRHPNVIQLYEVRISYNLEAVSCCCSCSVVLFLLLPNHSGD